MLKIVYAASPEPAVKPLQVLAENPGFEIVAVSLAWFSLVLAPISSTGLSNVSFSPHFAK